MPLYEYICRQCDHRTEALRKAAQADDPIHCERCGSGQTCRLHSVFSLAGNKASGGPDPLPMAPCGRCGDPGGSCDQA